MFLLCYNIVNKSSSSIQLYEKIMYKDMRNAIKNSINFCCYYSYSFMCVCKYKIHNIVNLMFIGPCIIVITEE